MNWDNAKNFIRKLPFYLWNALRWFFRNYLDSLKPILSADGWKALWRFGKDMMKGDFNIAHKWWISEVFKGKSLFSKPIPLEQGILSSPGASPYDRIVTRTAILLMSLSIFAGGCLAGVAIGGGLEGLHLFLLCIFLLILFLPILAYQRNNYRLGYLGECTVAEELEKYGRNPNWRIFHSFFIPGFEFDIDHIVVCSKGVFCVETKAWRAKNIFENGEILPKIKKVYGDPIPQTKHAAGRLQGFLQSKCSFDLSFVVPVVLFVNTYVPDHITHTLIIGNSNRTKVIFDKFDEDRIAPILNAEQIQEISKILEKVNRSDIEAEKEFLS